MGVINEPRYDEDLVTKSYLDKTIENTTGTIDGELSKLDSSVSRRAQNFGSEPTPPYYVNDTYMDGADIYICTTERLIGDFNAADWGKASDYTNDDFVNSLNKIFKDEPVPPYKPGDLWPVGPGGALYKCKTAKVLGESYSISDWELATKYDNMDDRVTAEGGFLTAGTIQVVQGGTGLVAGMTGQTSGDTAIRFWAGSTFDNRVNAPFRVTQAGAVTATSGSISGNLIASGINASNITAGTLSTARLNSDVITTTNFSAQNINADKITTGTLSTARLNSDVITTTNFSAQNINASKITTGTLTGRAISGGSINIGSGKFTVNTSGVMSATGATISGTITANSGSIGGTSGWDIGSGVLTTKKSGSTATLYADGRLTFYKNSRFYVGDVGAVLTGKGTSQRCVIGDNPSSYDNASAIQTALANVPYPGNGTGIPATVGMIAHAGPIMIRNRYSNAAGAIRLATTSSAAINLNAGTTDSAGAGGLRLSCVNNATISGKNVYLDVPTSGAVYARGYSTTSYQKVQAGGVYVSSKNIKKNFVKFKDEKYKKAVDLLKKIDIYEYDYKYDLSKHPHTYGFIIDEIESINQDNFFEFYEDKKVKVKNKALVYDHDAYKDTFDEMIDIKRYDPSVLDKYLLTVCKAQQMKIDELEKRLAKLEGGK